MSTYTLAPREGTLPDAAARPFLLRCTQPECVYFVSVKDEAEAQLRISQHVCPHKGGPTKIGLTVSRTILEQCWDKLDAALVELLEGQNYDELEKARLKGVCRGMAEILGRFMTPYLNGPDQISAEAKRRYDAKKAGDTSYTTPGLGNRSMTLPASGKVEGGYSHGKAPTLTAVQKAAANVGAKEKAAIKHAMASGMFQPADIAKMYGVTAAVIELITSES